MLDVVETGPRTNHSRQAGGFSHFWHEQSRAKFTATCSSLLQQTLGWRLNKAMVMVDDGQREVSRDRQVSDPSTLADLLPISISMASVKVDVLHVLFAVPGNDRKTQLDGRATSPRASVDLVYIPTICKLQHQEGSNPS